MDKLITLLLIASFATWGASSVVRSQKSKKEIKVMIIDTGVSPHRMLKNYVMYDDSVNYKDDSGHGTHVAGIIAYGNINLNDPLCDNVKIYSCKNFGRSKDNKDAARFESECVDKARRDHFDYVNFSGVGDGFLEDELISYKKYTRSGGIAVVAAGNEGINLESEERYPASFSFGVTYFKTNSSGFTYKVVQPPLRNVFVVQNETFEGKLNESSNYHPLALRARGTKILSTFPNNMFVRLTGTSQATPQILHLMLKQRCKELTK